MLFGVRGMWERSVLADEVGVPPFTQGGLDGLLLAINPGADSHAS